ncbi:MAG TPA: DNA polymerase III subunit delta' [Sporichthyaceae bacterium]|jgi:DNA polymerase-3 subunit delta'
MTVWAGVVGQPGVVATLQAAVAAAGARLSGAGSTTGGGDAMTHAWLLTGPPGSGRSVAARAFAAALQCPTGGCLVCPDCHTALAGSHADVELLATELLSIGVADTRELVRRAALAPAGGRWQVIICEDADRLTDSAANVLLKAIEEPPPRTVWILCAPSAEDVLPTIRSRARHLHLVTPSTAAVAGLLRAQGVADDVAAFAAAASQGHIGRARRLAGDPVAAQRRRDVLATPAACRDVPAALRAAEKLLESVKAEVTAAAEVSDAAERESLRTALGMGGPREKQPPGAAAALKDLETRQKKRMTRAQRDGLDRALVDLAALYRDVLVRQFSSAAPPVHVDCADTVSAVAANGNPELTLRRIEAVLAARTALDTNAAPLLTIETLTLALR